MFFTGNKKTVFKKFVIIHKFEYYCTVSMIFIYS